MDQLSNGKCFDFEAFEVDSNSIEDFDLVLSIDDLGRRTISKWMVDFQRIVITKD